MEILERTFYREYEPPPRQREKPMEVICPGFPRSGTESLQTALIKLGYDYTFHVRRQDSYWHSTADKWTGMGYHF